MTTALENLKSYTALPEFVDSVTREEKATQVHKLPAHALELDSSADLRINADSLRGRFSVSADVSHDLAGLAKIPDPYYGQCDAELRAFSFNHRLHREIDANRTIYVTIKDDEIQRVSHDVRPPAPRSPVLTAVSESLPSDADPAVLRVIQHHWNHSYDISIIAPHFTCEPVPGDIIAHGINIIENRQGAVQIHAAAFRLQCRNGAVHRVCDGKTHRLRRPLNLSRQAQFLDRVKTFALGIGQDRQFRQGVTEEWTESSQQRRTRR